MISPIIVAAFRSPPGEASRTMSPAARLAWSSLPRNQLAPAGPMVPLTKSARRPLARTIEMERVDHLRCQAGRDVLVLPVVPGLRLRQVPIGANEDAGNQQDEDGDRPEMLFAPGRLRPAAAGPDRPVCAAARSRGRSATCGSDFPRLGYLSVDNRSSLQAAPFRDRVIAFSSEVGTGSHSNQVYTDCVNLSHASRKRGRSKHDI